MKKIVLFLCLVYLIPFTGKSQFKEKHSTNNSGNNNSNNNSNSGNKPDSASSGGNNSTPKHSSNSSKKPVGSSTSSDNYNNPGNNNQPANGAKVGKTYTAIFDDGSKIDYIVLSETPADENKFTCDLPVFGIDRGNYWSPFSCSYYEPTKFFAKVYAGPTLYGSGINFEAEFLYVISSKYKPKDKMLALKVTGNVIKVVKHPIEKEKDFGIHGGLGLVSVVSKPLLNSEGVQINGNFVNSAIVALGIGSYRARHIEWFLPEAENHKTLKFTLNSGIFVDFVYVAASSAAGHIGGRAYIDQKVTFGGKHEGGLFWQYGFAYYGASSNSIGFPAFFGLGPFFTL